MARLVGLVVLWAFLGPPPALAGSGRVKLISKVPPTVRVCGGTCLTAIVIVVRKGLPPRVRGNLMRAE